MGFNFEITQGLSNESLKLGLYAPEGFGKSTFCTNAPSALTIDTENGTGRIPNCRRVVVNNWVMANDIIKAVIDNPTICKTLVIDTMDKLEAYAIDYLCEKHHKTSIEDWSYGKGYVALMEMFQEFYKSLDKVHDLGIHIMLVAHAKPRKFELPDQEGAYDRWELKLNKQTAPLLKEWVDALFFGNFKTYVVTTETKSKKAQGNKRVLFCNHQPTFDAKNRFNLPDEISFEFASISHLFGVTDNSHEVEETTLQAKETAVGFCANFSLFKGGEWKEDFDPFYGAPVILIVLADASWKNRIYDGSLVMGNMMLAAHSLGLGSIWIHRAKEEFETPFYKQLLKEHGIEGEWEGIGHCAIGYYDGKLPEPAKRKDKRVLWIE